MAYTLQRFESVTDVESYLEGYVDVEHFLTCCKECSCYGNLWSCPPYDFDPKDVWRRYQRLRVIGYRMGFGEDRSWEEIQAAMVEVKSKIAQELYDLEQSLPGSFSLSAGECEECEQCTRPEGKPCRKPDKLRYSIESLGGNVGKTISRLCGIEIEWIEEGKIPEHFVLVGGLLEK